MLNKSEVSKAVEHRDPQHIPVWDDWFADETWERYGAALNELMAHYTNDLFVVTYGPPQELQALDATGQPVLANGGHGIITPVSLPIPDTPHLAPGETFDEWGTTWRHAPGGVGMQPYRGPLADWATLDPFLANCLPDIDAAGRFDVAARICREHPDAYVMGQWWAAIWEQMARLRPMEELFVDLHSNRRQLVRLGDALCERNLAVVRHFHASGCDAVFFGDDIASQTSMLISPNTWRQVFRPWYKEILAEAHRLGMHTAYHSDGAIDPIIPDWIEIGLDILNPIQLNAMDIERVVREYGRDICFFGGIDVQYLLPRGTVQEIERECRRVIDLLGQHDGGYIASVANSVMPETPLENIGAMCIALRQHGYRHEVEARS